ncbi:hypothetical protein VVR26_07060 [Corynebacterium camporealensis]|uniref:hypothetical protein n=1 Tax=Corynebacterium camporealensis TaxID=161896 RepID=UPI0034CF4462
MILRSLGSPTFKVAGYFQVALVLGFSLYQPLSHLHVAYVRWPDAADDFHAATAFALFLLGIVVAFNVASLSTPKSYFETGLGRYSLGRQLIRVVLVSSLCSWVAILLGQLPTIVRGLIDAPTLILPYLLSVLSSLALLCTAGAVFATLGFVLRSFHPLIAALVAVLVAYVVVAISLNTAALWAVAPLSQDTIFSAFNLRNGVIALLVGAVLAVVLVAVVRMVIDKRAGMPPLALGASTLGSVLVILALAGVVQSLLGPAALANNGVCRTGKSGIEVCVDRADEQGLEQAVRDADAMAELSFAPGGPRALR